MQEVKPSSPSESCVSTSKKRQSTEYKPQQSTRDPQPPQRQPPHPYARAALGCASSFPLRSPIPNEPLTYPLARYIKDGVA